MKWSEVCERVQQPDGSVRTSPRIKGGVTAGVSPSRLRPASVGLGKINRISVSGPVGQVKGPGSSRDGSSRGGSSGKSSRSSSRDKAYDGEISSRCSSGCWDTSTNSSEQSRPRTPPDVAPSPSGSKALLMPDPVRTGQIFLPVFIDDESTQISENKTETEGITVDDVNDEVRQILDQDISSISHAPDPRSGPISFKWDPYGRDVPRFHEQKQEWSVGPLAKYLKRVVQQIDSNIENKRQPTADKLDAFVARLMGNLHRQLKHAPKKHRHTLQGMISKRFQRVWNFGRNEKVRNTTPEELKSIILNLVDNLLSEFPVAGPAVR